MLKGNGIMMNIPVSVLIGQAMRARHLAHTRDMPLVETVVFDPVEPQAADQADRRDLHAASRLLGVVFAVPRRHLARVQPEGLTAAIVRTPQGVRICVRSIEGCVAVYAVSPDGQDPALLAADRGISGSVARALGQEVAA